MLVLGPGGVGLSSTTEGHSYLVERIEHTIQTPVDQTVSNTWFLSSLTLLRRTSQNLFPSTIARH